MNAPPHIPIIGEPVIEDYFVTLLVKCACGGVINLVGQVGSVRRCPKCDRMFRVGSLPCILADGSQSNMILGATNQGQLQVFLGVAFVGGRRELDTKINGGGEAGLGGAAVPPEEPGSGQPPTP